MNVAILAPDAGCDATPYVYAVRDDPLERGRPAGANRSGHYPMRSFRVGATEYQLRRLVTGRVCQIVAGMFEFVVDPFAPYVIGQGGTPQAALDDWRNQVHALFQQLLAMRPFEMDASDRARRRALESIIDSAQLRRSTPVRMRQLGRVEYLRRPYPSAVHWAGGGRDRVAFEVMPPEFPSFKPGQWIEAICERDPLTGRLIRVTHVERIPEIRMMSREQQDQYWENLPTSDSLPESDLDWTRPG